MRITSLQNERVKSAVKLRDRKGREEQQRIIIDGLREIKRAVEAGVQVVELLSASFRRMICCMTAATPIVYCPHC